jgi:hypothetical protein
MTKPLKKVCKKALKSFKIHSKCCEHGDTVTGLVRFKGKPFHIAVSALAENFCVRVQSEKEP